jgi:hypothetical protein
MKRRGKEQETAYKGHSDFKRLRVWEKERDTFTLQLSRPQTNSHIHDYQRSPTTRRLRQPFFFLFFFSFFFSPIFSRLKRINKHHSPLHRTYIHKPPPSFDSRCLGRSGLALGLGHKSNGNGNGMEWTRTGSRELGISRSGFP